MTPPGFRLLPVLDVQAGAVVRGVGGRRREYRPVVSRLTDSARPADVAGAFRSHFGLTHLYLADLDALAGARPALPLYRELAGHGFRLWVDAGVRDAADIVAVAAAGVAGVVVGLETVRGPAVLRQVVQDLGPERVVFSLDLKEGRPLGDAAAWDAAGPEAIAAAAVALGVRHLIVLDLARVGGGGGPGTEELCRHLAERFPAVEVIAGGGVRGADDLRRLHRLGVRAALVASALHDGALTSEDVSTWSS